MSTHCGVAIKTEKGYKAIYVHHDGYERYMWPMLTKNYGTEELAGKLVSLGDASAIEERLEPTPGVPHTFDWPEKDVCIFYHRDRGENWNQVKPAEYESLKDFYNDYYYAYVWADGKWTAYKGGRINYAVETKSED